MMLPPIGFLASWPNTAPASTAADTWFVITTATPNSSASLGRWQVTRWRWTDDQMTR